MLASEYKNNNYTAGHRGRGFASGNILDNKHILRLATITERNNIIYKVQEEENILYNVREKVRNYHYSMVLVDAELQFDRHRLTLFFEANK